MGNMLPWQNNYRIRFKRRNVCCGLKSQEALRPIGVVARPMDMIFTYRRERGREAQKMMRMIIKGRWTSLYKTLF